MRTEERRTHYDPLPPPQPGRRFLIAIVALACLAGLVTVAFVSRNSPDALAELRVREGATGVRHGNNDFYNATEGEDLGTGDVIRTDSAGQAQVDFFDGSLTRLDGDTQLVIRRVADEQAGRTISLQLDAGRTWNRVSEQRGEGDVFEVHLPYALASVKGTTFITDCRTRPTCYVYGVGGVTRVESPSGKRESVKAKECVRAAETGLTTCDEKALGLLDDWVKQNLADDQQLELTKLGKRTPVPGLVIPTLDPQSRFVPPPPAPAPAPAASTPTPTPKPTAKPTAKPTEEPNTPKPTAKPTPSKTPGGGGGGGGGGDGDAFPD